MERLPDEILCRIMDQIDDETLLNSIIASDRFMVAFLNSSRHLSRLTPKATSQNIDAIINDNRILRIPFKNVSMSEISNDNLKNFKGLGNALKDSLESLELSYCEAGTYNFLIGPLSQLKDLTLIQCSIDDNAVVFPKMQNLKSVTFEECDPEFFSVLKNQPELEKLRIIEHSGFSYREFNALASSLPKLKHLVMEGVGTVQYFKNDNFPYKVEKLEAYLPTPGWLRKPRLEFLKSQKGSLKELTIQMLPYDYDGYEALKYIIEEMQLESFHYGQIPLILNGQKQNVKEFLALDVNVSVAFEMFRQFPTIETFSLTLTRSRLDDGKINRILSPRTDLFKNVRHLNILDSSRNFEHLYLFRGLYKNCRNIKKLTINSDCQKLDEVLQEVLPEFTQLNEIDLLTNLPNAVDRFQSIRNFRAKK